MNEYGANSDRNGLESNPDLRRDRQETNPLHREKTGVQKLEGVRKGYTHGTFSVASGCMSNFTFTTVTP